MINFVNGFSLSVSGDGRNVVINLVQNYPKAFTSGAEEDSEKMEFELIGSYVLGDDTARELADGILEILDGNDNCTIDDEERN